jgi:hypothetical protein
MKRITLTALIVGIGLLFASPDRAAAQSKAPPGGAYKEVASGRSFRRQAGRAGGVRLLLRTTRTPRNGGRIIVGEPLGRGAVR